MYRLMNKRKLLALDGVYYTLTILIYILSYLRAIDIFSADTRPCALMCRARLLSVFSTKTYSSVFFAHVVVTRASITCRKKERGRVRNSRDLVCGKTPTVANPLCRPLFFCHKFPLIRWAFYYATENETETANDAAPQPRPKPYPQPEPQPEPEPELEL